LKYGGMENGCPLVEVLGVEMGTRLSFSWSLQQCPIVLHLIPLPPKSPDIHILLMKRIQIK